MHEEDVYEMIRKLKVAGVVGSHPRVTLDGDPYDDETGLKFKISRDPDRYHDMNFHCRVKELSGCCGVLELCYPKAHTGKLFTAGMDVLVGTLAKFARVPKSFEYFGEIGNQLLATSSSESNKFFVPYLKLRGWESFAAAKNPRTGNAVKIWRKVIGGPAKV